MGFKLKISRDNFLKMVGYGKASTPYEIGGLCEVQHVGKKNYAVHAVHIVKQEVTQGNFKLDDMEVMKLDRRVAAESKGERDLYMLWHSHVTMATRPSSHDDEVFEENSMHGRCISMIVNNKGEFSVRIGFGLHDDFGGEYKIEEKMELVIVDTPSFSIKKLVEEVKKKISPPVYVPPKHNIINNGPRGRALGMNENINKDLTDKFSGLTEEQYNNALSQMDMYNSDTPAGPTNEDYYHNQSKNNRRNKGKGRR